MARTEQRSTGGWVEAEDAVDVARSDFRMMKFFLWQTCDRILMMMVMMMM